MSDNYEDPSGHPPDEGDETFDEEEARLRKLFHDEDVRLDSEPPYRLGDVPVDPNRHRVARVPQRREQLDMVVRTPTLSTVIAYVEYVEGDNDWGWWCWDWKDPEAFRAECIVTAAEELSLPPEQAIPEGAVVTHGYVRESKAGDEYSVRLADRPNGGHRATYIWGRM